MNTKDLLLRRRMMMEGRSPEPTPPPPSDYRTVPLTFDILSDGNILWLVDLVDGGSAQTIEYSKNGGEWTSITATTDGAEIPVITGDELHFRGTAWPDSDTCNFGSTCEFSVKGNPSSLKYGDVLTGNEVMEEECLSSLFYGCTGLISAENLALPATTLAEGCYLGMFKGCTSLTEAPVLPATTLAASCYGYMFADCTALTTAPELPATTLAEACYESIFEGCISLTTAPELSTTTLAEYCYAKMFSGCTSLTTAPELPATTLMSRCYSDMFGGCTSLSEVKCYAEDISAPNALTGWLDGVAATGTFTKAAGVNWPSGASGIPAGWTVVEV